MNRRRTFTWACAPLALALAAGAPGRAEIIDHGALEQLFGEPVTTSATGQPQRASDVPANMLIITAEDIRRSGAHDIPGVLRHVGGVDILEWSNGHTDVSVRGYNREFNPRLLVLIDGRQVYIDHHGFVAWNALPVQLEEIRQIELVKGPNAALFGFNAVGGVINIVTYNPQTDDISAASASVGTQSFVGGAAVETFRFNDDFAVRLSAGAHHADDFSTAVPPAVGESRTKDYERQAFGLDSVIRFSDDVHLRLDASHVEASRNEMAPALAFLGDEFSITSWQGRLLADTRFGLIDATAYTNRTGSTSVPSTTSPTFDFESRVSVFRLQDLFTAGAAHTFRAAGEYRRSTVGTTPFEGGEVAYDVYSLSGMWNWSISPDLSLTNAARLDRLELERDGSGPAGYPFSNADWNRSIEETSFNSGLVWRMGETDTLRLIAARGVQLPSLTNLGALLIVTPFYNVTGDPALEPSTVTSLEANWTREIPALDATFKAGVFHQKTENVLNVEGGVVVGPGAVFFTPVIVGDSRAHGLEVGLEGAIDDAWTWSIDYRLEEVDDDYAPPTPGAEVTSNFEDTTPEHLVNAHLGWSGGRWEVDGFARYQSDVVGPTLPFGGTGAVLVPIDAYTALDGRVGYALADNATFAVSGQNLGAPEQRQTAGPEVERRVMATLSLRY